MQNEITQHLEAITVDSLIAFRAEAFVLIASNDGYRLG